MKQLKQHWSFALRKCCITENILMPWACIKTFRSNSFASLIVYTVNDQRDSKTTSIFWFLQSRFDKLQWNLKPLDLPIDCAIMELCPVADIYSLAPELHPKRLNSVVPGSAWQHCEKTCIPATLRMCPECLRTTRIVPCRRLTTRVDPSDSGWCDWVSRQSQSGHCDHPAVGLALAITLRSQVIAWARLKVTDPCSQTTARDDPCRLKAFGALSQAVAPRTKRFTKIVTECHWYIHWTDL